jgi:type II secretory pathway pseudopilin PulG
MRVTHRVEGEQGETLLELLIAITLLGVAAVAIASGMALSIKVSDIHRKQSVASAYLHSYAESIENQIATSGYQPGCAPAYTAPSAPSGYAVSTMIVMNSWNGSAWSCGTDVGIQRLTLGIHSTDNRADEKLVIVVRKPCGLNSVSGGTC